MTYKKTWVSRLALAIPVVLLILPGVLAEPANPTFWIFDALVLAPFVTLCALIGRSELVLDDAGVRYRGLFSTRALRWDQIAGFTYSANPRGNTTRAVHGGAIAGAIAGAAEPHWGKAVHTAYVLSLSGTDGRAIRIDSGFAKADQAIASVLARVQPPLLEAARARLDAGERVQLGPLALTRTQLAWAGKDPLPLDAIEQVDIFAEGGRTRLRVIKRGKAWPYASIDTRKLPGAPIALALLRELGVEVDAPAWFTP